jgi:hypothetical protein
MIIDNRTLAHVPSRSSVFRSVMLLLIYKISQSIILVARIFMEIQITLTSKNYCFLTYLVSCGETSSYFSSFLEWSCKQESNQLASRCNPRKHKHCRSKTRSDIQLPRIIDGIPINNINMICATRVPAAMNKK